MASSDDEAESPPKTVSNYDFVDDKDEAVSFSVLPILWTETETPESQNQQVFLRGTADNGLQKIYKPVSAWRFDISNAIPELWVLSKDNNWIKLQKPRKIFEDIIRTILITVQSLHYVKRNPDVSGKSLLDHLSRVFSLYEIRPSQNDLVDHMSLISEAVKRDNNLVKSQFLLTFLKERPIKRLLVDEEIRVVPKSGFIVDDTEIYDDMNDVDENDSDEDEDLFDSVCAICDNGGEILCCEGKCMRSFHATEEDGEDSQCETLGFSREKVEAIENFVCKNCEFKQQQCFICGKLGSSDKSRDAEVFLCANATCGHYYHPHCVSKSEHKDNEVAADELRKKIAAGESFTCPIHKCCVCKQGENKKDRQLQFAVCRRCPKSYHRKCLPRKIAFQDIEEEGIMQRAWEDLLPNRILIYCLKHEIDEEIGTPVRDHIVFPGDREKKAIIEEKKKKPSLELLPRRDKFLSKKRSIASEDSLQERSLLKAPKLSRNFTAALKEGGAVRNSNKVSSGLNTTRKGKLLTAPGKSLLRTVSSVSTNANKSITSGSKTSSLGDQLYEYHTKCSGQVQQKKGDASNFELNKTSVKAVTKNFSVVKPALDADSERRILALMKESASSITMENIIQKHKNPSIYAHSPRCAVDKNITIGKVEGAVEAVRTALQKLEEGCSIEDARAVCEPEIVNQIFRWKNKLRVYLAPFLHGMRYTSFGRHFTKVEKLQEIVEKLHWYVQNGDTIVDFCCGANDFSLLMRKKLEEMGKKCSYRNFDVIQPKNDFNFEKRDWMKVRPKELPPGSQLIMGLNPPFGVKSALANKFIDKALEFKPKLLILIVPPETERLDEKKSPYDLVWEDDQSLSGKSFYLPGSVDTNDKQMDQWNSIAPPLYLWSRRDWTVKHTDIASKHGHIRGQGERIPDHPMEDCDASMVTENLLIQNEKLEVNGSGTDHENLDETRKRKHGDENNIKSTEEKSEQGNVAHPKANSPSNMDDRERHVDHGRAKNQSDDANKKKTKKSDDKHVRGSNERLPRQSPSNLISDRPSNERRPETLEDGPRTQYGTSYSGSQTRQEDKNKGGRPQQSPSNLINDRSSIESRPETREDGSQMLYGTTTRIVSQMKHEDKKKGRRSHQSPSNLINDRPSIESRPDTRDDGSLMQYGSTYSGSRANTPDDTGRRYNINGGDDACAGGDQRWYGSLSPLPEYAGRRSMDGQFLGHTRDGVDALGYNRPYMSEFDRDYGVSDIRSQIHLYGRQQDPDPVPFRGHNPGYDQMGHAGPYRHPVPEPDVPYRMNAAADLSYRVNTNTSAMQRYAPRLDEMNNYRMNPVVPEPHMPNRTGMYDPRAMGPGYQHDPIGFAPGGYQPDQMGFQPGYHPDPMGFAPGGYQPDSMGFAPGFQHPFPHKNSAGWLDD